MEPQNPRGKKKLIMIIWNQNNITAADFYQTTNNLFSAPEKYGVVLSNAPLSRMTFKSEQKLSFITNV